MTNWSLSVGGKEDFYSLDSIDMLLDMVALLTRNLDESVRGALRALAQRHGRSVEAEVRDILAREAKSAQGIDWGAVAVVHTGHAGHVTRDLVNSSYDDQEP